MTEKERIKLANSWWDHYCKPYQDMKENKTKYLIEYTWGIDNPIHESIETDDIDWTLDQFARNRGGIQYTKVIKIED